MFTQNHSSMSVSSDMLLHPELLSNEQLFSVLRERQLKIPHIEFMSRDELLELFHQFCVPLSQRRYKDTSRGKLLNKNRNIEATTECFKKLNVITTNTHSNKNDRLNPPPDVLSDPVKRIKLHVEKKPVAIESDNFSNKRKMMISCLSNADTPPTKRERKPITWP